MKMKLLATAGLASMVFCSAFAVKPAPQQAGNKANPAADVKVDEKEIGYILGFRLGSSMKQQGATFDLSQFNEGLNDALAGKNARFDEQHMMTTMNNYRTYLMKHRMEVMKKQAEENRTAGDKFFSDNKSKPGIVTLPSGIQYKVLEPGSGASPKLSDKVKVEYTGRLLNGDVFSTSDTSGKPLELNLQNTIKGWQEVVPLMKTGSTWEIFVPAKFAYGAQGAGPKIGPESSLIFKIKLVGFEKTKTRSDSSSCCFKTTKFK